MNTTIDDKNVVITIPRAKLNKDYGSAITEILTHCEHIQYLSKGKTAVCDTIIGDEQPVSSEDNKDDEYNTIYYGIIALIRGSGKIHVESIQGDNIVEGEDQLPLLEHIEQAVSHWRLLSPASIVKSSSIVSGVICLAFMTDSHDYRWFTEVITTRSTTASDIDLILKSIERETDCWMNGSTHCPECKTKWKMKLNVTASNNHGTGVYDCMECGARCDIEERKIQQKEKR